VEDGDRLRVPAFVLAVLLTVLLALWGAFLVPFRIGGTLVPVSWLLAGTGNYLLGRWSGQLLGRRGAGTVGLLWFALAFTLGSTRDEGDLVVTGDLPGLVFLLAGGVASAVAFGTTPREPAGRSPSGGAAEQR
jgi:peptidoglycan/LPS O-acetylase OafA/YrhL